MMADGKDYFEYMREYNEMSDKVKASFKEFLDAKILEMDAWID